jgi:prophage antirepressor-like protein
LIDLNGGGSLTKLEDHTMSQSQSVQAFDFAAHSVRIITQNNEPWFVAADVCSVLEISNSRDALRSLDDDEKGVGNADTLGGNQKLNIVNESGLYALIFKSRKPVAKKFRKWVTNEVLPAIRQTGQYQQAQSRQTYQRISSSQYHQLISAVRQACTGWCFVGDQAETAIRNRIRIECRIHRLQDLPAADLPKALQIAQQAAETNNQFLGFIRDFMTTYYRDHLGAGVPLTTTLKRQWHQQMQTALPERPDWRALQQQLAAKQGSQP